MPNTVAFSARSGDLVDLGSHQTVIFAEEIYLNIESSYDSRTGIFTCKLPGLYVFNVYCVTEPGQDIRLELVQNGVHKIYIFAPNKNNGTYSTSSNMAVLNLQMGDTVSVQTLSSHQGPAIDDWSQFTGFLLLPFN